MGALDFLKEFQGRVLDAASYQLLQRNYEMQEDNNHLLKDRVVYLEGTLLELREQNNRLSAENENLREIVRQYEEEKKYKIHEDIAFIINEDGQFDPTPYCPNCHLVMSSPGINVYKCSKCGYGVTPSRRVDVLAQVLNSKSSNQPN